LTRGSGPIENLESRLRPDWWRTIFTATYLKTDGDVVENPETTSREVDLFISALGLKPSDRVLDLCCGHGRHLLELWRRGFRSLAGADRSGYLLRVARRRARLAGADILLREADARALPFAPGSFDCVSLMGNSFGYLEDPDDDLSVLREARRVVRGGGLIYLDLADGEWLRRSFEKRSWEWLDRRHLACRERQLSADASRLVSREIVLHTGRGVLADQVYAERIYSREQIVNFLIVAGFEAIEHHGPLLGASERNQDLGMMAKRMLVSARAAGTRFSSLQGA
jgi:D-alanine-D-alanine ligase